MIAMINRPGANPFLPTHGIRNAGGSSGGFQWISKPEICAVAFKSLLW